MDKCVCSLTKVQLLDRVLKICGQKEGKAKYSDGQVTKAELIVIYKWVVERENN